MRYGFILAAGKQTRFKSSLPKALVEIDGKCLLDTNIDLLKRVCDKVYVVCSHNNKEFFDPNKYQLIEVESGFGSGDALYKATKDLYFAMYDEVIVCWGDVLLNDRIVDKLTKLTKSALIPCIWEEKPYVRFEFDRLKGDLCNVKVYYSKYGAEVRPGYHDMSIFKFDAVRLKKALHRYISEYVNPDNSYNANNNEFELLEVFNKGMRGEPLVLPEEDATKSFNTLEELNRISLQ